jgi:hypothetical protein
VARADSNAGLTFFCGRQPGYEAQATVATAEPGQLQHEAQKASAGLTYHLPMKKDRKMNDTEVTQAGAALWESNIPSPQVLAELYGPPQDMHPIAITIRALKARRDHIDMLIALIEAERAFD